MMSRGLIVACYTPGAYEEEAERFLLPSLKALGLPHEVEMVPPSPSWIEAGYRCQEFLLEKARAWPEENLLFLDVDAMVHRDPWPELSALSCHLAAHWFKGRELLTGTLYLPATDRREEILTRWISMNMRRRGVWDQKNLQYILERDHTIKVHRLGPEWCCIFDLQRRLTPEIDPIIEHFQASRRHRRRKR